MATFLSFHRFITCPIELIKIRQQNIVEHQPSTRAVAVDIFRRTGVRGLYRGITATALRDVGYGAYFATVSIQFPLYKLPVS